MSAEPPRLPTDGAAEVLAAWDRDLREVELRLLAGHDTDIITRIGPDGTLLYISPAIRDIAGYAPEDLVGRDISAYLEPQALAPRREMLRRLWAGEIETGTLEHRMLRGDGRWVPMEGRYRLVRDPATGRPAHIVASTRDISDRRAAERALRESEAQFRLLADYTGDMVTRIRRGGDMVYVSPSFTQSLGYTPAELTIDNVSRMLAPADMARFHDIMRKLWAGEIETAFDEAPMRHKDGHWIAIEARYRLVRDPETQAPTDVVISARDVTARVRAQQTLRESEATLRLLENATDWIVLLDLEFRRRYASPACAAMFGYSAREMEQDQDYFGAFHADDLPAISMELDRLRAGANSARFTYRRRHRDGHYLWVGATAQRTPDGDGYVMVVRDISDLKEKEALLREQREFFRALFEHTTDALVVLRPTREGRFAVREANQVAQQQAIGTWQPGCFLDELLPAEIYAEIIGDLRLSVSSRATVKRVLDRSRQGKGAWQVIHTPILEANGRVAHILTNARDISEIKAAKLALTQANSRMAMAEQMAGLGHVQVLMANGRALLSRQVYTILGLDAADEILTVEQLRGFFHPDDQAKRAAAIEAMIRHGTPVALKSRVVRADGQLRHVTERLQPEYAADGTLTSYFGIIMDVTRQTVTMAALREARDAAEAHGAELAEQALTDALTGLPNRRRFDRALAEMPRAMARGGTPLGLAMIDVDCFKLFNDRYGHAAGDDCLRMVGVTVQSCLKRRSDLAARYGGEEFAVLLPETDLSGAAALAEDIRASIRSLRTSHADSPHGVVTVSIGVAAIFPKQEVSAGPILLRLADAALYRAKSGGRDRVALADQVPDSRSSGVTGRGGVPSIEPGMARSASA